MINDDIQEQESIIEDLLENARLKNHPMALNQQASDINGLIDETIKKRKLKRIHYSAPKNRVMVDIDQNRIQRVLNNLLENSLKYAPPRSRIDICLQPAKGYVRISVADRGPGIADGDKERIFEPFYRLDSSRTKATGGYGLGLSLCRQIVEAHGGRIFADNGDPAGLVVVFTLPRKSSD